MNRNVRIQFRLTKEEHTKLLELADEAQMNVSEFLRTCILRSQILPRPSIDFHELVLQFRHIGNNINQVIATAHSQGFIDSLRLREQLDQLWELEQQASALFTEG